MKLKLQEKPGEWLKFTVVLAAAGALAGFLLLRRRVVAPNVFYGWLGALALMVGVCVLRPRWFRGFYRAGMTVSFRIGQGMERVWLTIFFLVVLTPLGLLLRLLGKDLLQLKRKPGADTYWHPAKTNDRFDRLF